MKTRKRTKNWSARRNLSMVAVTHYTSVLNESKNICYFAHSAGNFSGYTLCSVSLVTAAAISVDRLLALLMGLRYRQLVTLRRTCIIAFGFWILSSVGSSTIFWNPQILLWYQYIGTALCLVTAIFAYTKISYTLRHNQIHDVQNHVAQGQPSQAIRALNIARYRKAVYSALWVQGTLIVCYLPFCIVDALSPQRGISSSVYLARQFAGTILFLNSSLNPLLYCWKIRDVRHPKYVYHAESCEALNYEETTGQKVDALTNISTVIYINVC